MYLKYIMCTSGRKTLQGKNWRVFVAENFIEIPYCGKVLFCYYKKFAFLRKILYYRGYRYMEVTHYGKSDGSEHQC